MNAVDIKVSTLKSLVGSGTAGERAGSAYLSILVFYGTLLTILISAVPYGTVEAWHKGLLVSAIAVLGGLRLIDGIVRGNFRVAEHAILRPAIGVLVLAAVQIAPIPFFESAISMDPYETKSFILVFGSLIVCGEILFTYTDSVFRLKLLVALVVLVGISSAVFGFLRELLSSADDGILDGYFRAGQGYAQFINRNHFAVLMEMALGLMLGLLLKGDLSEKLRFLGWVFCGTFIYSMIAANSRGGLFSLAALSIFAVFVHVLTRSENASSKYRDKGARTLGRNLLIASSLCVLVCGVIVLTVAFVGGDTVVTRIERIGGEVETLDNSRLNRNLIWASTVELIKERPLLGSGFGGYEAAISEFDTSAGTYALRQAHNDYLEILSNGGVVGFLLFTAFAIVVIRRIKQNLSDPGPVRMSCCFGALIGMFGVLTHSFVDFGLHVLINALLFVVLVVIATIRPENMESIDKGRLAYPRMNG